MNEVQGTTDGPSTAQMEAGARALRECGLNGSRESLMATAASVWRAMQEVRVAPVAQPAVGSKSEADYWRDRALSFPELTDDMLRYALDGKGGPKAHSAIKLAWPMLAEAWGNSDKQRGMPAVGAPVRAAQPADAEQAAFEAWCPYRGSPDPRIVWAAAWRAAIASVQPSGDAAMPVVAKSDHQAGIIRDLRAIAVDRDGDFWPTMLAAGALSIIEQQQRDAKAATASLQADLAERDDRIASMRVKHGDEISHLLERDNSLRARLNSLTSESGARIAELEESAKVLVAALHDAQNGLTTPDLPGRRTWHAGKLVDMGGAGVTVTLAQPEALDWGVPEIVPDVAEPSIDAANLAPAQETFMHAVPDPVPVDMLAVCNALGFDPTNHHNAAKCPYCRLAPRDTAAMLAEHRELLDAFETTAIDRHKTARNAGWQITEHRFRQARDAIEASAKRMLGIE